MARESSAPSAVLHATDILGAKTEFRRVPVVVLFGTERFLKLEVLKRIPGCQGDEADLALTRVEGRQADLRTVLTDLTTVSMFGDQRMVLIEDADDFVTEHRVALEKYVAHPARTALLILDVKSWPKNTRLYKAVEAVGVAVECSELKGAALVKWLQKLAADEFGRQLDRDTAALIVQLAGDSAGLLQQEVAKLASYVGDNNVITQADVVQVVGGWRTETTWVMLDAVRDQQLGKALEALDKLLLAGEAPQKILGGTTFSFRKLAEATEAARTGTPLPEALRTAGVIPFSVAPGEQYLRRIGFEKASRILQWLVEADHDMKGGSKVDPRLLLERLFVRLSGEMAAPA